ncbi:hypothetical protein [Alloactinosynnema sp. L-07]|uniref:hypothetical protein n=1 Tax=Alloactinosynnema sp. L-07 TaxID=1653480 RepID=UPI0012FB935B|nr:hypothetical protein [Alloactinosynnema sp. L-07]
MISYPAPELVQGSDEGLLVEIAAVVFPEIILRDKATGKLRIWVQGNTPSEDLRDEAASRFQTTLGILRAWAADAGELAEELRSGLGTGGVYDQHGNAWVMPPSIIARTTFGGEIEAFSEAARLGMKKSLRLANSLWLNGRPNRNGADVYMIYEYAEKEFGGKDGIRGSIGLSAGDQKRLTSSANNLPALHGGRHAELGGHFTLDMHQLRSLASKLLRNWIESHAGAQ